ncbi:MAG: alpha/beta hydrolase [Nocardioides sp.]|uniref:alpha/beta hydrolase n=1 Tax=Nocardioides sp. TaxID=35761 RepID=UPI003266D5EC
MTVILVPAHVAAIEELEATAAASSVTSSLRSTATTMSDVSEWMTAHGAPADWTGDSSEAANHAMTQVATSTDGARAAFTRVAVACDKYVDRIVELTATHAQLVNGRTTVNREIDSLNTRIEQSTADDIASLQGQAEALQGKVDRLVDGITKFWDDVESAEDALIAAFQAVDSTHEGQDAADRDTTDIAALRAELTRLGGDPGAINDWWKDLTPAEREALKISDPDLIGNANGIPTGDRDDANRSALERDMDYLETLGDDRTSEQDRELAHHRELVNAMNVPGGAIDPATGLPVDVNLIVYQPHAFNGDGAVAVSYGDPDTADNTAVIVPGLTNDAGSIAGQGRDAYELFKQAAAGQDADPPASTATIAWMGYDAPNIAPDDLLDVPGEIGDVAGVGREQLAENGGHLLSDFVDGLRASDQRPEDADSNLTVIGHSYGSTTAAHSAADGLDADALTLIGSPGAGGGVDHVSDLNMPEGKVYVGSADNDFVTWLGRDGDLGMGHDPSQADFGATRFGVDDGKEFHIDDVGQGVTNHTSYFDPEANLESLDNLATIVTGDEPTVIDGRTQDANDMALDWVKDEAQYQADRAVDATLDKAEEVIDGGKDWVGDRVDDFTGLWP